MTPTRALLVAVALIVIVPRPARADATLFLGATVTPSNRSATGFAVEVGVLIVGFEFEYSRTGDDASSTAPSLKTGMGNLLLQTPFAIFGFQPYATAGIGIYREELGTHEETGLGSNVGGGVKIGLLGPLRLRVDYRVFNLGNGALVSPAHRIYTGLNLSF